MNTMRLVLYAVSTGVSLYWVFKDFKRERQKQDMLDNADAIEKM